MKDNPESPPATDAPASEEEAAQAETASSTQGHPADAIRAETGDPSSTANGTAGSQPQPEGEPAGEADTPAEPQPDAAEELAAAREETKSFMDRYLRAQAELENFKRRSAKENEERLKYALIPFVKEVAAVMDNLERAVDHARQTPGESGQALLDGIEMVVKQMQEAFSRSGVIRIEAEGKPFDPNLHEAMTVVETSDVPQDHVVAEFQAGYLLHDRVVRPARVSVAKAPGQV